MIQTGLIPNAHNDLITDAAYDFYGIRLATCSLDQRIKIWEIDESNNWNVEDGWKAHDAAISKLSWAHPEFGSLIASASFDRTVKIWEHVTSPELEHSAALNGSQTLVPGTTRWVERAVLSDAKGTVRSVEFAPHQFGLKLATISSDNILRIYDCIEQPSFASWQLIEELDIQVIATGPSPNSHLSRTQTMALATPTQTNATMDSASASLVAQALQQGLQHTANTAAQRQQLGNREADGGWCLSWCKDKYWGEIIAVGCGTNGIIKVIQINARRSSTLICLPATSNTATRTTTTTTTTTATTSGLGVPPISNPVTAPQAEGAQTEPRPTTTTAPAPAPATTNTSTPSTATSTATATAAAAAVPQTAITSVAWAPSCGRSYHLIATGGRDGHVRIWKVKPGENESDDDDDDDDDDEEEEEEEEEEGGGRGGEKEKEDDGDNSGGEGGDAKWTAVVVADFDHHRSSVGRVEWNVTGTILSSAGNDGRIRLWKATVGSVWRPAGSLGVEQTTEVVSPGSKDVEMET